jgi:hypothetical protein
MFMREVVSSKHAPSYFVPIVTSAMKSHKAGWGKKSRTRFPENSLTLFRFYVVVENKRPLRTDAVKHHLARGARGTSIRLVRHSEDDVGDAVYDSSK